MTLTQINKAGLDELALDHVFTIGASGSDHYTFQGEGLNGTVNDPTLYLTRGKTYRFENGSGGHPIRIQSTSGASGTAYNTGVTNNAGSGTVIVEVQHDAPDVLYYQCTSHAAMNGILYITGALADGGVTTAKIADDAVTDAKLANSINSAIAANTAKNTNATHTGDVTGSGSLTIASNAVTTAKIADGNVTAAKLASGVQTTINNNANNRVITGSGTANTLEAQANILANGTQFGIGGAADTGTHFQVTTDDPRLRIKSNGTNAAKIQFADSSSGDAGVIEYNHNDNTLRLSAANAEQMRITSTGIRTGNNKGIEILDGSGHVSGRFINTDSGANAIRFEIDPDNSGSNSFYLIKIDGSNRFRFTPDGLCFNSDSAAANALDDYEEGTWTPTYLFGGQDTSTYTGRGGYYTKVGNLVFAKFALDISSRGNGSGHMSIGGLPFTIADKLANTGQEVGGMISYFNNLDLNVSQINFWGQNGNNYLQLQYLNGSGSPTTQQYLQKSNINNDTGMRGYVIYQSA